MILKIYLALSVFSFLESTAEMEDTKENDYTDTAIISIIPI